MPPAPLYDLVLGDAFHGVAVPYHLTTKEFNDSVRAHLKPDGSSTPLNRSAYVAATAAAPRPDITQHLWDGDKLNEFMLSGRSVLLTDDCVPVDNLFAPVFEERGF